MVYLPETLCRTMHLGDIQQACEPRWKVFLVTVIEHGDYLKEPYKTTKSYLFLNIVPFLRTI